jgi:AAA domain/Effector-associated domain 7
MTSPNTKPGLTPDLRTQLRNLLVQAFDQEELNTLCSDLIGNYQQVPEHKADITTYAREIVSYFDKRQALPRLIQAAREQRPTYDWPSVEDMAMPLTLVAPLRPPNGLNPFHPRGRINDPAQFFGRERELREVRDVLRKRSSVALIGERQIGKSSLQYYLWATRAEWLPDADLYYLDLQRVMDTEDFCETILKKLGESGSTPRDLKRALEARIEARRDVILLLDEVERFSGGDIDPRIPDLFRSLAQERHFALCVAGHQALDVVFPPKSNGVPMSEIGNIFEMKFLRAFDEAGARAFLQARLAETGVRFAADEVDRLWRESAGHPAKLQALAYEAFARYGEGL